MRKVNQSEKCNFSLRFENETREKIMRNVEAQSQSRSTSRCIKSRHKVVKHFIRLHVIREYHLMHFLQTFRNFLKSNSMNIMSSEPLKLYFIRQVPREVTVLIKLLIFRPFITIHHSYLLVDISKLVSHKNNRKIGTSNNIAFNKDGRDLPQVSPNATEKRKKSNVCEAN